MSAQARIYAFPGVDDAPGDRPATFDEYLVSIGLSTNTVRNYVWRLNKAEKLLAEMGGQPCLQPMRLSWLPWPPKCQIPTRYAGNFAVP